MFDPSRSLRSSSSSWLIHFLGIHHAAMLGLRYQRFLYRIILSLIISVVLLQLFAQDTSTLLLTQITSATSTSRSSSSACTIDTSCHESNVDIPNIVNVVYILPDPDHGSFAIQFSQYLSIYAAWYRWRPDAIYLHTNVNLTSDAVQHAKSGKTGKWAQQFFNIPSLKINTVNVPTHTATGKQIKSVEHQSDFVRVQALYEHGGIYIDLDVHALRDISPLLKSGYSSIGGRQFGGSLNSGAFLSAKYSRMTKSWMQRMHQVYDGGWTTHSNSALTTISNELKRDTCEIMTLPQTAFAPVGWLGFDQQRLFDEHYPPEDINQVIQNDSLADFAPDEHSSMLSWTHDFQCTYLLHAFSIKKMRHGFNDNGISPRYVLERRSVFARTVYPVLQDMYRKGYVNKSDFDL